MINNSSTQLFLTEIFYSIQGETSFSGFPTVFIRLSGCNLRCSWCDTTNSFTRGKPHSIEDILNTIDTYRCQTVCVTGGEPLLQSAVHTLMTQLCDQSYRVSIETGGSLSTAEVDPRVHTILDIKCPGTKMCHKTHWENLSLLRDKDEVKFVIADRHDYEYAKNVCDEYALFKKKRNVLFSPVFDLLEPVQLVDWILEDHLPIRLNLQTHKFIWSPETKGV